MAVREAPIINAVPTKTAPKHSYNPKRKQTIVEEQHRSSAPRQVLPPRGTYRRGDRVVRIKRKRSASTAQAETADRRRPGRRPVVVEMVEQEDLNQEALVAGKNKNVVRFVNSMFDKEAPAEQLAISGGRGTKQTISIPRDRSRHMLLRTVVIARAPRIQPTILKRDNRTQLVKRNKKPTILVSQGRKSKPSIVLKPLKKAANPLIKHIAQTQTKAKSTGKAKPADPNNPEFKPLSSVSMSIAAAGKDFPTNLAAAQFSKAGSKQQTEGASRDWNETMYFWEPSALCHNPLYFEEVNLERYGYTRGKLIQPVTSAAHFFGRVIALPYLTAAEHPRSCVYTLGHYRPGTYAPYRHHYPPRSAPAGIIQAGVTTGLIFAFP